MRRPNTTTSGDLRSSRRPPRRAAAAVSVRLALLLALTPLATGCPPVTPPDGSWTPPADPRTETSAPNAGAQPQPAPATAPLARRAPPTAAPRAAAAPLPRAPVPAGSHLDPVAAAARAEDGTPHRGHPPAAEAPDHGLRFTDVATAVGVDFQYTIGDYAYDNILESSGSGVAWLDVNGDGWLDLYLLNGRYLEDVSDPKGRAFADARNALFCNLGDGTFVDCSRRSGLDDTEWSMGAAAADYDNDGDEDVFVANYGPNRLFRNDGEGRFSDVAAEMGLQGPAKLGGFVKWSAGGTWFDADGDGDLDLMVCNFLAFDPYYLHPGKEWEMPDPKEYGGQPSLLYLQGPDGRFTDVTAKAGLLRPDSKCMGITVLDFDGDGRPDIFQGNDHQPNFLWRARGDGTYEDLGFVAGVAVNDGGLGTGSMHGSPGDVDGDGLLDLLVVDLRHGALYRRTGPLTFVDATWPSGVGRLLKGLGQWGAGLHDLDLDGDLDLFTTNGVAHILVAQSPALAVNDGQGRFEDARRHAGAYFQGRRSGRCVAFGDYDNDGDLDLAINHVDHQAQASLLRNDSRRKGNWIGFTLQAERPRCAHGAHLTVRAGDKTFVRTLQPNSTYLSQNEARVHVGLGPLSEVREVEVRWPGGATERFAGLAAGRYWTLKEGAAGPARGAPSP